MAKAPTNTDVIPKKNRRWPFWLGGLLSLIALLWLGATTNWLAVGIALQEADYRFVLLATAVNLLTIPLRAIRWQTLFPSDKRPPFGQLISAMLIGQATNLLAPARLGDLVRASLINSARTSFVLGTIMVQTALDLLMTAVLVLILLFQVSLPDWWRESGWALLASAALVLSLVTSLILGRSHLTRWLDKARQQWAQPVLHRILELAHTFLSSLDTIKQPVILLSVMGWTGLIWAGYGLVNYLLLHATSIPPNWIAAFFVLVVLQLGAAVPSSPGRIGVFHYLGIQALLVFGVGRETAVSYATLLYLISLILPILLGVGLAWYAGISLTRPQPAQSTEAI